MVSTKLVESSIESNPLEKLKVGDLVEFFSVAFFAHAKERYSSNGVVVAASERMGKETYTVIWSDGKQTNEWRCYLRKLT